MRRAADAKRTTGDGQSSARRDGTDGGVSTHAGFGPLRRDAVLVRRAYRFLHTPQSWEGDMRGQSQPDGDFGSAMKHSPVSSAFLAVHSVRSASVASNSTNVPTRSLMSAEKVGGAA